MILETSFDDLPGNAEIKTVGDQGETTPGTLASLAGTLTPKQTRVLDLLANGLTQAAAAARLGTSQAAVSQHWGAIRKRAITCDLVK